MPSSVRSTMAPFFGDTFDPELETVCQSLQRSYSLSASDLYFKIESYILELSGNKDQAPVTKQLLEDLRVDLQEQLERKQQKQKAAGFSSSPVAGVTPAKRKIGSTAFGTPITPKSSPLINRNVNFASRPDAGKVLETLNPDIQIDFSEPALEKAKIKVFMDVKRYQYRTMRQALFEVSEYLDERIERFGELMQEEFKKKRNEGSADEVISVAAEQLSNPGAITHEDVIVVGRIVSDSVHAADSSRINVESVLLEASRGMGSGARIPLKFALDESKNPHEWFSLFPGQIVALRGNNPSGSAFVVRQVLTLPDLPFPVSPLRTLRQTASNPTRMVIAKGPFTTYDDLAFDPLEELINQCVAAKPDVLILLGPFIDITHPQLFNPEALPDANVNNPEDLFKATIAQQLNRLEHELPAVQVFLIPESSAREAIQRHVSFPAPPVAEPRKALGLSKRSKWLCNPSFVTVNSSLLAVANVDTLMQLSKVEYLHCGRGNDPLEQNMLARNVKNLILQRSLYPVFPGQLGVPLEVSYLGLADMNITRPDILIIPSDQRYFAKVVDNVIAINPGALTKLRTSGTYAIVDIAPVDGLGPEGEGDEDQLMVHKLWERCRVDIKKI